MEKIIKRIKNIEAVVNLELKDYEEGSQEIIDFVGNSIWYREELTTLKTLIWSLEAIDDSINSEIVYLSNGIEVKGLPEMAGC